MTTLLIDADVLLYQAAVLSEDEFDPGQRVYDVEAAKQEFDKRLETWRKADPWGDFVLCISSAVPNFRREMSDDYKAGRREKPLAYAELLAWVLGRYPCERVDRLEADDVMGLLSGPGKTIVSPDKDMKTIPGRLYNPLAEKVVVISPHEADWWWMYQVICGDPVDGYKGIPRAGDKAARRILGDTPRPAADLWPAVLAAYRSKQLPDDYATLQARLARILRPGDFDWKAGAIALWEPEGMTE
ncbi:hypothetical protein [Nitrospirillum iridis]|uniref:DNA polymerase-1 n=1 Tax=Nitrospirillum iridis TaxID=765888 RepID=A0A7X0B272_9PROT|nr:hypothetical protein [Nitrospirillum iridis]MBB6253041.1 DNA polymerase-1 [Nitrospirillum iridis]